jgi:acyl carrier protein
MSNMQKEVTDLIAKKLGVDVSKVVENANLINDLGADSLDQVELVMELEEKLGIEIPEEKAQKITTVGDLFKFIESHQK